MVFGPTTNTVYEHSEENDVKYSNIVGVASSSQRIPEICAVPNLQWGPRSSTLTGNTLATEGGVQGRSSRGNEIND
jgi:hypothetical protein